MRVLLLVLLPAIFIGAVIFAPLWDRRLPLAVRERAVTVRVTILTWLVGFVLALGLLFFPDKPHAFRLIPIFFAFLVLNRLWKRHRLRACHERGEDVDVENMKRVN